MTDNIEAALGKGKRKGKGIKEIKDKVVKYVKNNKSKLLKAVLIGAPVGAAVGATVGHLLSRGRREPEPEQFIQPTPIVPFSGRAFRLPLRLGEPARPVGEGLKEIKDKVVGFVKKHKGKIATAATLGALATAYKNGDKIMDYVDQTRLGQTETGQKILGNLGYAMGHLDVYKGLLEYLWDKYRKERFGSGISSKSIPRTRRLGAPLGVKTQRQAAEPREKKKEIYILGAGIKDFWNKHKEKIKKAAKLAIIAYNVHKIYKNWDTIKSNFKYGKVVYDMGKDLGEGKDLDVDKYVNNLADVFPRQRDRNLENGAVLFQETLRNVFGRNIQDEN
jgi:hypothetical protein